MIFFFLLSGLGHLILKLATFLTIFEDVSLTETTKLQHCQTFQSHSYEDTFLKKRR